MQYPDDDRQGAAWRRSSAATLERLDRTRRRAEVAGPRACRRSCHSATACRSSPTCGDRAAVGRDFRRLFAVRLARQASDGVVPGRPGQPVLLARSGRRRQRRIAAASGGHAAAVHPVGPFAGVLLDAGRGAQVLLVANAVRALMVVGVAGAASLAGALGPAAVRRRAGLHVGQPVLPRRAGRLRCRTSVPRHELRDGQRGVADLRAPSLRWSAPGWARRRSAARRPGDATDAVVLLLAALGYAARRCWPGGSPRPARPGRRRRAADPAARCRGGAAGRAGATCGPAPGTSASGRRPRYALAVIGAHRVGYGAHDDRGDPAVPQHFSDPADVDAGLAGWRWRSPPRARLRAWPRWSPRSRPAGSARLAGSRPCLAVGGGWPGGVLVRPDRAGAGGGGVRAGPRRPGASKICVDTRRAAGRRRPFRGRVFSFYDMVFNVAVVVGDRLGALLLPPAGGARLMALRRRAAGRAVLTPSPVRPRLTLPSGTTSPVRRPALPRMPGQCGCRRAPAKAAAAPGSAGALRHQASSSSRAPSWPSGPCSMPQLEQVAVRLAHLAARARRPSARHDLVAVEVGPDGGQLLLLGAAARSAPRGRRRPPASRRGLALVAGGAVGPGQPVQPLQQRPGVGDVAAHRRVGPARRSP